MRAAYRYTPPVLSGPEAGHIVVSLLVCAAPSSSPVQDTSLSRMEQGFESPWGHSFGPAPNP